jgi:hypothetical protein
MRLLDSGPDICSVTLVFVLKKYRNINYRCRSEKQQNKKNLLCPGESLISREQEEDMLPTLRKKMMESEIDRRRKAEQSVDIII